MNQKRILHWGLIVGDEPRLDLEVINTYRKQPRNKRNNYRRKQIQVVSNLLVMLFLTIIMPFPFDRQLYFFFTSVIPMKRTCFSYPIVSKTVRYMQQTWISSRAQSQAQQTQPSSASCLAQSCLCFFIGICPKTYVPIKLTVFNSLRLYISHLEDT